MSLQCLENENNPLILKELIKLINADNQRLRQVLKEAELEKAKQLQKSFSIAESLKILQKKFFGKSSEKSAKDRSRKRNEEDPEVLFHSQNVLPPVPNKALKDLDVETRLHEMTDIELKEASAEMGLENPSADQWQKVENFYDESTEIEIIERSYKKVLHRRQKYKLKSEFNQSADKESVLITAEGAHKLLPGSMYSIDLGVSVVVDKYLNHLPLERQVRMMDSLGLRRMSTQTLYNMCHTIAMYLEPVAEKIKTDILSRGLVHSDETPWPINNSKDSDGYMWIIANQMGAYYRFEPTRSGKVIKETLQSYQGTVMTDAYGGYSQFKDQENIDLVFCHAHARRYFKEIEENYPEVAEYLDFYKELFAFEKEAKTFEELKRLREEKSKPLIEKMRSWLFEKLPQARNESALKKAIEYSLKNWNELTKFLENSNAPLTNNEAERTIRQAVMGRKNFYGSRSIDGADVAATIYTVIESCKRLELDPRDYLLITIRKAAKGEAIETPFEMAKRIRSQLPA